MSTGRELEEVTATATRDLTRTMGQEGAGQQYLTFTLGEEYYGVDILRVREIKGWTPVTRIPNTPEYLRGVLNLRGTVVPIADLRLRFNLERVEYTPTTVVIVLCVNDQQGGERTLGIVVDGVSDVLNVTADQIKPTPDFGAQVSTEFISGLVSADENMVMLLDIDRLLDINELSMVDDISAGAEEATA